MVCGSTLSPFLVHFMIEKIDMYKGRLHKMRRFDGRLKRFIPSPKLESLRPWTFHNGTNASFCFSQFNFLRRLSSVTRPPDPIRPVIYVQVHGR